MRVIVYGIGAIGGVIAAGLALSGHAVEGIARGKQLEAIRANGLTLRTPETTEVAHFPIHADPTEIDFTEDDVILLTMKSQDTGPALERLKLAGVVAQPVVCCQNGVANERMALRHFETVLGVRLGMPADYNVPGEVVAFGTPKRGTLDIGRYPSGIHPAAEQLAQMLEQAHFEVRIRAEVMPYKYRKLLGNLRNAIDALIDDEEVQQKWFELAQAEGKAALSAAGIACDPEEDGAASAARAGVVPGMVRLGSSSLQSILRASGSIETDYLNGEIVLLGRLYGVLTPVNAALCRLSQGLVTGTIRPGGLSDGDMVTAVRWPE